MTHRFTIGQSVDLASTARQPAAAGKYEIRRLMPASDSDPANPCYRVKNIGEKHERLVRESEITLSRQPEPIFS